MKMGRHHYLKTGYVLNTIFGKNHYEVTSKNITQVEFLTSTLNLNFIIIEIV